MITCSHSLVMDATGMFLLPIIIMIHIDPEFPVRQACANSADRNQRAV